MKLPRPRTSVFASDVQNEYEEARSAFNSANIAVPIDLNALDFNARDVASAKKVGRSSYSQAMFSPVNGFETTRRAC